MAPMEGPQRYSAKTLRPLTAVILPRLLQRLTDSSADEKPARFSDEASNLATIAGLTLRAVSELFNRPCVVLTELEVVGALVAVLDRVTDSSPQVAYWCLEALIECSELLIVRSAEGGGLVLAMHPEWAVRLDLRQAGLSLDRPLSISLSA